MSAHSQDKRNIQDEHEPRPIGEDLPKMEGWIAVCLLAFVPMVAAAFVPPSFTLPLMVVAFLVLFAGVAMFLLGNRSQVPDGRDGMAD